MEAGYRIDILLEDLVLIEIKSIDALAPVHFAQTLTYLKLSNLKLAILINFNVKFLKEGIHRIVNHFNSALLALNLSDLCVKPT